MGILSVFCPVTTKPIQTGINTSASNTGGLYQQGFAPGAGLKLCRVANNS